MILYLYLTFKNSITISVITSGSQHKFFLGSRTIFFCSQHFELNKSINIEQFTTFKQSLNRELFLGTLHIFLQPFFFTVLQSVSTELDVRVTALEENGGDDGNSSVAELEVRVETLEGTAADHETRISAAEIDINGKCFSIGGAGSLICV